VKGPRGVRSAAALVCSAGALACSGPAGDTPDPAGTPDRVVVVAQPYLTYGALWFAEAEGLFDRRGLDVELVRMAATEPAVPLLLTGEVDVLTAHPAPAILNAILRDADVRMVLAASGSGLGGCTYLALLRGPRPEAVVRGTATAAPRAPGRALAVSRVSVNRQAVMRYVADRMFALRGLSLDDLELVDVQPSARIAALSSGALDAVLAGEPFLTRTREAGAGEVWTTLDEALPGARLSFLFFGSRLLQEDRDVGERFVAAYLEALQQLGEGKTPRNRERLADAIGEDPGVLARACWPFAEADGRPEPGLLRDFQGWAVERELLDEIVPLDRLWDPSVVEAARAILDDPLDGG